MNTDPQNVQDPQDGPQIDMRRLPFEIARLGIDYRPGLYSRFDPDGVAIQAEENGPDLGKFPYYRLISPKMTRIIDLVEKRTATVAEADQIKAIIRDGGISAPPDSDFVFIHLDPGHRVAIHRGLVVEEWPEDDMEMPEEWRQHPES